METKNLIVGAEYLIKHNPTQKEFAATYQGSYMFSLIGFNHIFILDDNYIVLEKIINEIKEKQAKIIELVKQNKDKIVFKEKITLYKENYVAIEYNEFEDGYFLRGENFLVNKRFLDVEEMDDLELILETVKENIDNI